MHGICCIGRHDGQKQDRRGVVRKVRRDVGATRHATTTATFLLPTPICLIYPDIPLHTIMDLAYDLSVVMESSVASDKQPSSPPAGAYWTQTFEARLATLSKAGKINQYTFYEETKAVHDILEPFCS